MREVVGKYPLPLAAWAAQASILSSIETVVMWVELLGVAIVIVAILIATVRFIRERFARAPAVQTYESYRTSLARGLLLGLEILIAADVIRTVTEQVTLDGVVTLGLLVLVRTFLTWSLVVEIEQRWPWERPADSTATSQLFDPEAASTRDTGSDGEDH